MELFPIQVTEYKEHWKDWYREEQGVFVILYAEEYSHLPHGSTAMKGIWSKSTHRYISRGLARGYGAISGIAAKK